MRGPLRLFAVAMLLVLTQACAGAIVELPVEGPLDKEQIKAALQGDDFRVKAHARDELHKMPEPDRIPILQEVLKTADAQTRLLIVSELSSISLGLSEPILQDMAANDQDPEIREYAAMTLEEKRAAEGPK